VDEGRGLERLPRPLTAHVGGGEPPELVVDLGRKLLRRRGLAFVRAHELFRCGLRIIGRRRLMDKSKLVVVLTLVLGAAAIRAGVPIGANK